MVSSSSMTEDYLKALYSAEERGEDGLGVTELARRMGVVASTASENVRKLRTDGLVDHAPYQKVHMTEAGRSIAVSITRRHRILETYLYERLGFNWDEVHREAEILEHAVSDTLLARMEQTLGYPARDPHGDPIPPLDGKPQVEAAPLSLLSEAPVGTSLRVERISDNEPALLRHLDSLGIVLDAKIEIVERLSFAGILKVAITPPPDWHPRTPEMLASGVGPSLTYRCDLSEVAAEAVSVALA